jgi:hypothetical protein
MKKLLLFLAIFYGNFALCQLNETFNDDDLQVLQTGRGAIQITTLSFPTNSCAQIQPLPVRIHISAQQISKPLIAFGNFG